jgi:predicted Co/Zn/Cd cation transporter (cation efflux family)
MNTTSLVLAQMTNTATEQARVFFGGTALGEMLSAVLGSVGLLLIVWSLVKAFKAVMSASPISAIKSVVTAVIVAAFLFSPVQFGRLVDVASRMVDALLNTFGGIVGA